MYICLTCAYFFTTVVCRNNALLIECFISGVEHWIAIRNRYRFSKQTHTKITYEVFTQFAETFNWLIEMYNSWLCIHYTNHIVLFGPIQAIECNDMSTICSTLSYICLQLRNVCEAIDGQQNEDNHPPTHEE